ncbi:MAG TPA: hypothetical protein VGX69_08920 [Solirubrobacteraceae bacterium]|jgi:hypothetical protein|nr:hypothetical protein [Solirubrobacteraceae bacterium]
MRHIAGCLLVALAVCAGNAAIAQALEPAATTQTGAQATTAQTQRTTAPTSTAGGAESSQRGAGTTASSNSPDDRGIAIAILLLGIASLGFAYLFYDRWRGSYQALAGATLRSTGHLPSVEVNPVELAQFRARGIEAAAQQPVLKGPAAVHVGESVVYAASVGDAPANCTWSVQPADAATVTPSTGPQTTLVATKEGALTLAGKVGDGAASELHLVALPATAEGKIPLLGVGFGGVAAAISAFAIAGALTALNIVSGSAFIAFLGPLVGYFFAQSREGGGSGGSK